MRRETTNKIRYVLEELIPPAFHDSWLFHQVMGLAWGNHVADLAKFRARAPFLSEAEYEALYRVHPRIHDESDLSVACVNRIADEVKGSSVCDVGCGTGYLLSEIRRRRPEFSKLTGVDFVAEGASAREGIDYVAARIEDLPFPDNAFDTVICTHVIEHVLDYRKAISELRRIARTRLIVVVPREREYAYTFNPHFHFFPYTHSFLRAMHPVASSHVCVDIQRDIYYREDVEAAS